MINENTSSQAPWQKIWDEIKDKEIEVFALPRQSIDKSCKPVVVNPAKLYLTAPAMAYLPAIESALGNKYAVEMSDKYIVVTKA